MTSQRKHVTQMSLAERLWIWDRVKSIPYWKKTDYTNKRLQQRRIHMLQALETVKHSEIIEYHIKDNSRRILLRGTKLYQNHVVCVVFDIDVETIITAYWNETDDTHETLNHSQYNEKINIIKEFEWKKNG